MMATLSKKNYQVWSIGRNADGTKRVELAPEIDGQAGTFAAGPMIAQVFPADAEIAFEQVVTVTVSTVA